VTHPVTLAVGALWAMVVALALLTSDLSASAGTLPGPWVGGGMFLGLLLVGCVAAAVWHLPEAWPRLVRFRVRLSAPKRARTLMGP
jgi:hypothetical protein